MGYPLWLPERGQWIWKQSKEFSHENKLYFKILIESEGIYYYLIDTFVGVRNAVDN